jgi:site-specific recombinase XerD
VRRRQSSGRQAARGRERSAEADGRGLLPPQSGELLDRPAGSRHRPPLTDGVLEAAAHGEPPCRSALAPRHAREREREEKEPRCHIDYQLTNGSSTNTGPGAEEVSLEERIGAAYLVRYRGNSRDAYRRDLQAWAQWCTAHHLPLLEARRQHVELWLRELEDAGEAPSTRKQRLAALSGYYQTAVDEGVLTANPAVRVRRPPVDEDSQRLGVDRDQGKRLLAAAEASGPRDHLLACLLLLEGLRVSEALGLDVDDLAAVPGHRVAHVLGKGGKRRDVALAPRTIYALDTHLGDRTTGAILSTATGKRMDRKAAWKVIHRLARVSPHSLRHGFVTAALDAGVPLHRVQDAAGHADPRTTRRYDRARNALDNHAAYAVGSYFA